MKRDTQGRFRAVPTTADYAFARRVGNVESILRERGYGDEDACSSKAVELVRYAFQSATVERRDVDDVLRSCLKHLMGQS